MIMKSRTAKAKHYLRTVATTWGITMATGYLLSRWNNNSLSSNSGSRRNSKHTSNSYSSNTNERYSIK